MLEATSPTASVSSPHSSKSSSLELQSLISHGGDEHEDVNLSFPKDSHGNGHFPTAAGGTATPSKVATNIFISFVGCGMLGMPYAFSQSGHVLGSLTLAAISTLNLYAMLNLCETRKELTRWGHSNIRNYGDVGKVIGGKVGEVFVNALLVLSQVGFATAYIISISANVLQMFHVSRFLTCCLACIPLLVALVQITHLATLAPFSLLVDVSMLTGSFFVLYYDYQHYADPNTLPHPAANYSSFLYVADVSIYALEGAVMILPLESSCADPKSFPSILTKCMIGITSLMILFGLAGYVAFGDDTFAPITWRKRKDGIMPMGQVVIETSERREDYYNDATSNWCSFLNMIVLQMDE